MLQRLIAYSLMIIAMATYPTHVHAFELQMDEQLSGNTVIAVVPSRQAITTKQTPQPTNPPIFNTIQTSSSMQLWWLLGIPVFLLFMGFGWMLGHYMEKRSRIDKKNVPQKESKGSWMNHQDKNKQAIAPQTPPSSEVQKDQGFHIQTVQLTVSNPKSHIKSPKKKRSNIRLPNHLICWMFIKPTVVFYFRVMKKC
ncbi:MAG: hypothetical protein Q9M15_06260 [Mariprofundaceae bacterium]|nr:hypothetical protein [Mariprofundaceae bacterium]